MQQFLGRAAWKIRAADTSCEQRVTAEQVGFGIETHAAGSMARGMYDCKFFFAKDDILAVNDTFVNWRRGRKSQLGESYNFV